MNHRVFEENSEDTVLRIPELANPVPLVLICRSDDSIAMSCEGSRYLSKDRSTREEFYDHLSYNLVHAGFATVQKKYASNKEISTRSDATFRYRTEIAWIEKTLSACHQNTRINPDELFILAHGFSGYIVGNYEFLRTRPIGYVFASCPYRPYEHIFMNHCEHIRQYYSRNRENEKRLMDFDPVIHSLYSSFAVILRTVRRNRTSAHIQTPVGNRLIGLNPPLCSSDSHDSLLYTRVVSPSLIIHGAADLHVPLGEVLFLEQALKYRGIEVHRELIPGADHWFRDLPPEGLDPITDMISGEWIKRPFRDQFFKKVGIFCNEILARKRFSYQTG